MRTSSVMKNLLLALAFVIACNKCQNVMFDFTNVAPVNLTEGIAYEEVYEEVDGDMIIKDPLMEQTFVPEAE